eukprot:3322057-Rhodomonas_salina.1
MSGTDIASRAIDRPVPSLCDVRYCDSVSCYAVCGTEIAQGSTPLCSYALCGTELCVCSYAVSVSSTELRYGGVDILY